MSEPNATSVKPQKQSSPRYPFISLTKALERAEQFKAAAGANAAFVADARAAWGYGLKSSGGDQTIAALSYYGLIEDIGGGATRKLKLSEAALRYFRDERPEVRQELLARFALSPKIMSKLWEMWKHEPPSDSVARSILKVDLNYSDYAANELLSVYKDNVRYILADKSAATPATRPSQPLSDESAVTAKVQIGDYIQWTSGGFDQFPSPERVTWISEDQTHVRIEGSLTAIPVDEVTVTAAPPVKPVPQQLTANSAYSARNSDLSVLLTGNRLQITANVDRAGLVRLKEILTRYEGILELMEAQDAP